MKLSETFDIIYVLEVRRLKMKKSEIVFNTARTYLIIGEMLAKNGISGMHYFAQYYKCIELYNVLIENEYQLLRQHKKAA